MMQLRE
jgi:hypothetical protein